MVLWRTASVDVAMNKRMPERVRDIRFRSNKIILSPKCFGANRIQPKILRSTLSLPALFVANPFVCIADSREFECLCSNSNFKRNDLASHLLENCTTIYIRFEKKCEHVLHCHSELGRYSLVSQPRIDEKWPQ